MLAELARAKAAHLLELEEKAVSEAEAVSRHDTAELWVAFFSRRQRSRCRQARDGQRGEATAVQMAALERQVSGAVAARKWAASVGSEVARIRREARTSSARRAAAAGSLLDTVGASLRSDDSTGGGCHHAAPAAVTLRGARALGRALPAAALRGLDICFSELLPDVTAVPYASMANDGLDLLGGEALGACDRLSELYLGFSLLGAEATLALAQSLPSMRALQTLFLRDAGVEEGGAIALSEALPQCGALTALDLSCNAVGDKGAIAIAQAALQEGGGLTSLSLASQCPAAEVVGTAEGMIVPLSPPPIPVRPNSPSCTESAARSPHHDRTKQLELQTLV